MNLPYTTLTPILGDEAPYDPNTETTPEFMNGKFKELLENDTAIAQQINVLKTKTSFSPTPLTGFAVLNNASYIQDGIAHINLKVKKDSGYFDTTTTAMCTLPFASKIPDSPFTSVFGEHGVSYKEIAYNVFANSSTIYVRVATTNSVNFVNLIGEVIIA